MLIEQAIFTSVQTGRRDGYQIVAHSPGVDELDLPELALRSPSHDALWEVGDDATSFNFFPLPSGCYCVSKTTPAGQEYSVRRGPRVYSQCLLMTREVLAAYSNNAFAIMAAAFAQGQLRVLDEIPLELEPFRLSGRTPIVDEALLSDLASDPGSTWLQAIVGACIAAPDIALLATANAHRLVAGLINCLPLECRLEFSFSTGLKYSPRRPFRIVCLGGKLPEQRRLAIRYGLTVVEVSGKPPREYTSGTGWGRFVASAVAAGKTRFLAEQLSLPRPGLTLFELDALGNALLEAMASEGEGADDEPSEVSAPLIETCAPARTRTEKPTDARRADASHARNHRDTGRPYLIADQTADSTSIPIGLSTQTEGDWANDPSHVVGGQCPAAIEKLEMLDDLVFETIAGKPGALDQLRRIWPDVLARVGPSLVEESREQYLRHALRVWRDCVEGDQIHNPSLALATMEVICLLFGDV